MTADEYRKEVVSASSLVAFLYMPTGEQVLEMVHSLKKCGPEKDLPSQVRMKIVGFTGDCGPNQKPTPVIPPPSNMWKWKEVEFATDEVAFSSFYGAPGNNEKLWAPTAQKIQKKMRARGQRII